MQAYKPQHTGAAALVLRALKAMGCATKQQLAQAQTEEDRQRVTMAARFGLAALDHRDLG